MCVCDLLIYPSGKGGRKREREKVLVTEMYKEERESGVGKNFAR